MRQILGFIVAVHGAANALSWLIAQGEALGVRGTVSMKFATAMMFVWCGTYRAASEETQRVMRRWHWLVIVASLVINTTIEKPPNALHTVAGLPSLATLLCFILVPMGRRAALVIITIAVTALVGHASDVQWLFWHIPGVSTGMAIMTAVLFVALGVDYGDNTMDVSRTMLTSRRR